MLCKSLLKHVSAAICVTATPACGVFQSTIPVLVRTSRHLGVKKRVGTIVVRQQNIVTGPVGLRINNDCVDEDQQQHICPINHSSQGSLLSGPEPQRDVCDDTTNSQDDVTDYEMILHIVYLLVSKNIQCPVIVLVTLNFMFM
jgi:hypothetical protein